MTDEVREGPPPGLARADRLREFNALLQRDSTDTTYKFALLRALVEIAEREGHLVRRLDADWVGLPLGLIVDRWIAYYLPFVLGCLPQRNGERPEPGQQRRLKFRGAFEALLAVYPARDGYAAFCADYFRRGAVPAKAVTPFRKLVSELRNTITQMPMKHLGYSLERRHYAIVDYLRGERVRLRVASGQDLFREQVIGGLGTARLRLEWYETFRTLGGFATGAQTLLAQWARFTAKASAHHPVALQEALEALLASPDTTPSVDEARKTFQSVLSNGRPVHCAWSGKAIVRSAALEIDHAIPFSVWGSNELWNLLPAHAQVNRSKADRIPRPELVRARAGPIVESWQVLRECYGKAFDRDFSLGLTGSEPEALGAGWPGRGLEALVDKCRYLIEERGFEPWTPP